MMTWSWSTWEWTIWETKEDCYRAFYHLAFKAIFPIPLTVQYSLHAGGRAQWDLHATWREVQWGTITSNWESSLEGLSIETRRSGDIMEHSIWMVFINQREIKIPSMSRKRWIQNTCACLKNSRIHYLESQFNCTWTSWTEMKKFFHGGKVQEFIVNNEGKIIAPRHRSRNKCF